MLTHIDRLSVKCYCFKQIYFSETLGAPVRRWYPVEPSKEVFMLDEKDSELRVRWVLENGEWVEQLVEDAGGRLIFQAYVLRVPRGDYELWVREVDEERKDRVKRLSVFLLTFFVILNGLDFLFMFFSTGNLSAPAGLLLSALILYLIKIGCGRMRRAANTKRWVFGLKRVLLLQKYGIAKNPNRYVLLPHSATDTDMDKASLLIGPKID